MDNRQKLSSSSILVVEDDPVYRKILEFVLQKIGCQNFKIGTSFTEGIDLFQQFDFDICLLDIELGDDEGSGINLAEQIRSVNKRIPIIFITSHFDLDHYFSCRHTNPVSFIDKKVSLMKFTLAIELGLSRLGNSATSKKTNHLSRVAIKHENQKVYLNTGEFLESFKIKDILYFFNKKQKTYVRVKNRNVPLAVSLKAIEQKSLPFFVRIHKSYIVNFNYIDIILKNDNKVKIQEETLPIGSSYREDFFTRINPIK